MTSGAQADHQGRKWMGDVLSISRQPQLRRGIVPQKWQRWIPFEIDAFFGSSAVQAMHPAAQMGYWRLLCAQWQTDDCSLSGDPLDLAEKSGLGDELWALYGPRILRQFPTLSERSASTNGTLSVRNPQCYEKWEEAKKVAERRKSGAERTNSVRSATGKHTLSERLAGASRAGAPAPVPVSVFVPVVAFPENGDSGSELAAANWLLEELGVVADNSVRRIAAESIRLLAREGGTVQTASEYILAAGRHAKADGETITRFWFSDQRYRPQKPAYDRNNVPQPKIRLHRPGESL